jgi:hypothetical protein
VQLDPPVEVPAEEPPEPGLLVPPSPALIPPAVVGTPPVEPAFPLPALELPPPEASAPASDPSSSSPPALPSPPEAAVALSGGIEPSTVPLSSQAARSSANTKLGMRIMKKSRLFQPVLRAIEADQKLRADYVTLG